MKEKLKGIMSAALSQIAESTDVERLNAVKVNILGKKGELTELLKGMRDVVPEERPKVGQLVNETRAAIEAKLEESWRSWLPKSVRSRSPGKRST